MTDSRDSPLSEEETERLKKALAEQRKLLGSAPLSKEEREAQNLKKKEERKAQNLKKAAAILTDSGFYKAIECFFEALPPDPKFLPRVDQHRRSEVAKLIGFDDRFQHFQTTDDREIGSTGWKCKINDKFFELRGHENAYFLRYQSEVVFEVSGNPRPGSIRIALLKKEWLDVIPRIHEVFQDAIDSHNITLEAEKANRKREKSPQIDLGDFE